MGPPLKAPIDRQAFEGLVLEHQASLRGFIARFILDPEVVFDLAQETFVKAYGSLDRFQPAGNFQAWLRGIAANCIRNYFRTENRRRSREMQAFELTLRRWHEAQLRESGGADDRLAMLVECIEQLDAEGRALVNKRYFEGIALQTLASECNKRSGALAMELLRLRAVLAHCVHGKLEASVQ